MSSFPPKEAFIDVNSKQAVKVFLVSFHIEQRVTKDRNKAQFMLDMAINCNSPVVSSICHAIYRLKKFEYVPPHKDQNT